MNLSGHLFKISLVLICASSFASAMGKVPVDVVTDGKDVFFLLEKPAEIEFLEVSEDKAAPGSAVKSLWLLGHDVSTPVKSRKYLKTKQLRYGQAYDGFTWVKGPLPLQKNVEYHVKINLPGKFASEVFIITENNTVIMPHPSFVRQKKREYNVFTDKNGDTIFKTK